MYSRFVCILCTQGLLVQTLTLTPRKWECKKRNFQVHHSSAHTCTNVYVEDSNTYFHANKFAMTKILYFSEGGETKWQPFS